MYSTGEWFLSLVYVHITMNPIISSYPEVWWHFGITKNINCCYENNYITCNFIYGLYNHYILNIIRKKRCPQYNIGSIDITWTFYGIQHDESDHDIGFMLVMQILFFSNMNLMVWSRRRVALQATTYWMNVIGVYYMGRLIFGAWQPYIFPSSYYWICSVPIESWIENGGGIKVVVKRTF